MKVELGLGLERVDLVGGNGRDDVNESIEALIGFRGGGQQSGQEGTKQGFSSASCVMDELEEGKIVGQLFLRDAPVRPQPGAQQ